MNLPYVQQMPQCHVSPRNNALLRPDFMEGVGGVAFLGLPLDFHNVMPKFEKKSRLGP